MLTVMFPHRTARGQRRCRHVRAVHAPDEAPPQGGEVRHPRRVRDVEAARAGHGIPVLRQRAARPQQLQGRRGLHRERPPQEGGREGCRLRRGGEQAAGPDRRVGGGFQDII
ncbi:hypothetical protein CSUB01_12612, partial [Colletotrichum sublineola]